MRLQPWLLSLLIIWLARIEPAAGSIAVPPVPHPTLVVANAVAEYGYRYYTPELSRWLNLDPLAEIGGPNLYGFLSNDGLSGQDLLGCIDWHGLWDITKNGEIISAGYRGARHGVGNVYRAGKGVVTAPSQFGAALGKEVGDYLYLPDEFDGRWADRLAMLDALVNDPCYRQRAIDALKKEFGDSIADGSLFANLSVDILSSVASVGIAKQLDRLNELIKLGKLQKVERTATNSAERAKALVHDGMEVRAVRDLGHVDDSTLAAMAEKGFATRTINGGKIVLHHHQQNPSGFIVEMPSKNHNIWNTNQHPFGNTPSAGLSAEQRAAFDAWRRDYWKTRANAEIQRRAAGQ